RLLRFGTVDSWLVWKLTGGKVHVTDVSNASRTMLFNIREMKWDEDLLDLFGIPMSMLPQVRSSSEVYGYVSCGSILDGVPVAGIAGDQQAALLGQMCTETGSMKCTYGTGCFLLMNCGDAPVMSSSNLLTTVAWKIGNQVNYAMEGSVFVAGSLVQWLRDGLGIIRSSSEIETLARQVPDSGGVFFVPALTGLGAPHWDPFARGAIYGIGRGTKAAHIARAALEGIAFQTMDIMEAMCRDVSVDISQLKVDGGASRNDLLMQIQADLTGVQVVRPVVTETTAFGAACLAALAVGLWDSLDSIRSIWKSDRQFIPSASPEAVRYAKAAWADVVKRTLR
ncbi:MAG: FGGY family carbohydrate kinase, partial [Candidatus Cryptobacteroides sp.]